MAWSPVNGRHLITGDIGNGESELSALAFFKRYLEFSGETPRYSLESTSFVTIHSRSQNTVPQH